MQLNAALYKSLPVTGKNAVDQHSAYVPIGAALYDKFFRPLFATASGRCAGQAKYNQYMFAISDKEKLTKIINPACLDLEFEGGEGKIKVAVKVSNDFPFYIGVVKSDCKARFRYDATVLREFDGEWVHNLNFVSN